MPTPQPRYSTEEFAHCRDELYEREIWPRLKAEEEGKFVVIDLVMEPMSIDTDELAASDRLLARYPQAQMWLMRVGSRYIRCHDKPF